MSTNVHTNEVRMPVSHAMATPASSLGCEPQSPCFPGQYCGELNSAQAPAPHPSCKSCSVECEGRLPTAKFRGYRPTPRSGVVEDVYDRGTHDDFQ